MPDIPKEIPIEKYPGSDRRDLLTIPARLSPSQRIAAVWDLLGIQARYEMPIAKWKFRQGAGSWEHWNEETHAAFRHRLEFQVRIDPENGQGKDKFRIRKDPYEEAVSRLALECMAFPLREWVETCKVNPDSPLRLDNWLTVGFGSPETDYSAFVQEYFWTSLVLRILEPGCKVKCAVVFVGASGIGKSPMLEHILPSNFRADFVFNGAIDFSLEPPRLYPSFEGRAIIILGEMSHVKKAEEAVLKSTLDASFLDYIPKHIRSPRNFKMAGVFAGTANPEEDFLPPGKNRKRKVPCSGNAATPFYRRLPGRYAGRGLDNGKRPSFGRACPGKD